MCTYFRIHVVPVFMVSDTTKCFMGNGYKHTVRVITRIYNQIETEIKAGHMRGSADVRTANFTRVSRATIFYLLHDSKNTGTSNETFD